MVDVAGDGQRCGCTSGKSWMIDVPVVQYFGLTGGGECRSRLEVLVLVQVMSHSLTRCCRCGLKRLFD